MCIRDSVYIGNPSHYVHGVSYPAAPPEARIVALQLRVLLSAARAPAAKPLEKELGCCLDC